MTSLTTMRLTLSTIGILLVMGSLIVPTAAAPGDDQIMEGVTVEPSDGPNGAYATNTAEGVSISITEAAGTGGAGVNPAATTEIKDIVQVTNEGEGTVEVRTAEDANEITLIEERTTGGGDDGECVLIRSKETRRIGLSVTVDDGDAGFKKQILERVVTRQRPPGATDCTDPSDPVEPTPPKEGGGGEPTEPTTQPPSPPQEPTDPAPQPSGEEIAISTGHACTVQATAPEPANGTHDDVTHQWTIDGEQATGATVSHRVTHAQPVTIELQSTYPNGEQTTQTRTLQVNDRPTVQVVRPERVQAGQPTRLEANVSDASGVEQIDWRFADGERKTGEVVEHRFKQGNRTVEVVAVDECGATAVTRFQVQSDRGGGITTQVASFAGGFSSVVRFALVALLTPVLFALDRRWRGRRQPRRHRRSWFSLNSRR